MSQLSTGYVPVLVHQHSLDMCVHIDVVIHEHHLDAFSSSLVLVAHECPDQSCLLFLADVFHVNNSLVLSCCHSVL